MILSFDPGTINLGYAALEIETRRLLFTGVLNIKKETQLETKHQLVKSLADLLDRYSAELTNLRYVLIEKQPGHNAKMRAIETVLITYFHTVAEYNILNHPSVAPELIVIQYRPINKFKTTIPGFTFAADIHGSRNYRNRKKEIQRCTKFLYDYLYCFDICDAIMQAWCYIEINFSV